MHISAKALPKRPVVKKPAVKKAPSKAKPKEPIKGLAWRPGMTYADWMKRFYSKMQRNGLTDPWEQAGINIGKISRRAAALYGVKKSNRKLSGISQSDAVRKGWLTRKAHGYVGNKTKTSK